MFNLSSSLRKFISVLTIFALLFSSTAPAMAASWNVNHAQQYTSDTAMLICTGSTFKWISSVDYYANGKLTFVEPPADAPNNISDPECANAYLSDTDKQPILATATSPLLIPFLATELDRLQRPFTSFPYQSAHSRAPPII